MEHDLYFENVSKIGNLYMEHIFLEFEYEPILFTCSDKNKQRYICLCSEIRGKQRWIISKCNIKMLNDLISCNIDMVNAFRSEDSVIIVESISGVETSKVVESKLVDELDLPKPGTMLRCNLEAANKYILEIVAESISEMEYIG